MPHTTPGRMPRRRTLPAVVALALSASLGPGLVSAVASADDATCVGRAEFKRIKSGMGLQKLGELLDGQAPLADLEASPRMRVRWYAACDGWQPVKDVRVRYHKPLVGRRTVAGKNLGVYEPETAAPAPDPPRDPGPGPRGGKK